MTPITLHVPNNTLQGAAGSNNVKSYDATSAPCQQMLPQGWDQWLANSGRRLQMTSASDAPGVAVKDGSEPDAHPDTMPAPRYATLYDVLNPLYGDVVVINTNPTARLLQSTMQVISESEDKGSIVQPREATQTSAAAGEISRMISGGPPWNCKVIKCKTKCVQGIDKHAPPVQRS